MTTYQYANVFFVYYFSEALVLSDSARRSITKETRLSYIRAWTYGITTIGASFFAIKVMIQTLPIELETG